jgi:hypothetical protein
MVNSRHSKGCKLCRRKKKGCDLSQPICGRCLNLGAKCTYEDRSWILVTPQQQDATINRPTPLARASVSPPCLLLADRRQHLETFSSEAHLPGGRPSTGDNPELRNSFHAGPKRDATRETSGGHVHKNRSRDFTLDHGKKCILTAENVAQDIAVIAHIRAPIFCFRSPVAERVVGMMMWVEAFMPPSAWNSSVLASALGAWAPPRCKSQEYGNDAVVLLNIGCGKGDDRLILAGRRLHLAIIQTLRNNLACSSSDIPGIFAALLDLMLASCYTVVSPGVATWLNHLMGQTCLLQTRLTGSKTTGFGTFVFIHYRQLNLIHALVSRKRMPLAISDWNVGSATPSPGSFEAMYRLALQVPALLELTDQLIVSTEDCVEEVAEVKIALLQLESSLLEWFKVWIALKLSRKPLASALTDMETSSEPCATLCFEDNLVAALVWCLLLLLHESVYELTRSLLDEIHIVSVTEVVTPDKVNTYAVLLYQSVHHLYQQAGAPLSKALAVSAPLHFVKRWYSRVCDTKQVERCIALESDLQESAPNLDLDIALFWSFLAINWLLDEGF